jgi:hypothetical protein
MIRALVTPIASLLLFVLSCGHAFAAYVDTPPPLLERLTPEVVAQVFPDADRVESAGPRRRGRSRATRCSATCSRPWM